MRDRVEIDNLSDKKPSGLYSLIMRKLCERGLPRPYNTAMADYAEEIIF